MSEETATKKPDGRITCGCLLLMLAWATVPLAYAYRLIVEAHR